LQESRALAARLQLPKEATKLKGSYHSPICLFTSYGLFVWLISHQPAVLFYQNKTATSNQPTIFFSQQISTSHQPPAKRTG
jgi:hypothetical protein